MPKYTSNCCQKCGYPFVAGTCDNGCPEPLAPPPPAPEAWADARILSDTIRDQGREIGRLETQVEMLRMELSRLKRRAEEQAGGGDADGSSYSAASISGCCPRCKSEKLSHVDSCWECVRCRYQWVVMEWGGDE